MGFWQGLNAGLSAIQAESARKRERQEDVELRRQERDEERKFRIEMWEREMTENFRRVNLDILAQRKEQTAAIKAKVAAATAIGLSELTATSLLRSGQLDLFLSQYEKNEKVDPQFISSLNLVVEERMGDASPESISQIMLAGVITDRDVTDPNEASAAIAEAILSAEPDQLDEIYLKLQETSAMPYTPLPRFDLDFTTLGGAEETETKAIRRELAESLGTYFEDSISVTDSGDVVINQSAEPAVRQLFNEAERRARDMAFGPTRQFTPTDAARAVATNLETAIQGTKGMAKAGDILQNFDTVLTDPQAFVTTFTAPEVTVPEPAKPETVVEGLGNADMGFGFNVDEVARQRK